MSALTVGLKTQDEEMDTISIDTACARQGPLILLEASLKRPQRSCWDISPHELSRIAWLQSFFSLSILRGVSPRKPLFVDTKAEHTLNSDISYPYLFKTGKLPFLACM